MREPPHWGECLRPESRARFHLDRNIPSVPVLRDDIDLCAIVVTGVVDANGLATPSRRLRKLRINESRDNWIQAHALWAERFGVEPAYSRGKSGVEEMQLGRLGRPFLLTGPIG